MNQNDFRNFLKSGGDETQSRKRKRTFTKAERNKRKKLRAKENRAKRVAEETAKREKMLADMTEEERTKWLADEEKRKIEKRVAREAAQKKLEDAMSNGMRICVDCNWTERMQNKEKDMQGVVRQMGYSYGANRRAENPISFHICASTEWEALFKKNGCIHWKAHIHYKPVTEVFDLDEIIYLSPDAEEELTYPLDNKSVYVIGGIIDKTVVKNLSLGRAKSLNVKCKRLPKPTKALRTSAFNVNTVVEMLIRFQDAENWAQIMDDVIPDRCLAPHLTGKVNKKGRKKAEKEAQEATSQTE